MTTKEIQKRADRSTLKYELAKKVRQLLDEARKTYGPEDWESDDIETELADLIFGD